MEKKKKKKEKEQKIVFDPKSYVEIHGPLEQQFAECKCVIYERPENPAVADLVLTNCRPALMATIRSAVFMLPECVRFHPEHVVFCSVPDYVTVNTIAQFLARVQIRMEPTRLQKLDSKQITPLSELNDKNAVQFEIRVAVPADRPPILDDSLQPLPLSRSDRLERDFLAKSKAFDKSAESILGASNWNSGFRSKPYAISPDISPLPEIVQQLHTVRLGDLKWMPMGSQFLWDEKDAPSIVETDVPLVQLRPGDEFHIRIFATRDSPSPRVDLATTEQSEVAQATYHDLFDVTSKPGVEIKDPDGMMIALEQRCAAKTGNAFPQSVFDIELSGQDLLDPKCQKRLIVARPWACTGCRGCLNSGVMQIKRRENACVMTIVTTGKKSAAGVAQETLRALLAQHRRKRPYISLSK